MLKNKHLKQWSRIVSEQMPHLSITQVVGLATWSFGMVMTRSSSLTQVSKFIALVNEEKPNTVRQRLKEWYQEAQAKKGQKRCSFEVSSCFSRLLTWIIELLPKNLPQIGLALDATSISNRFTVLSINVLLAGGGIPVAWCIVRATEAGTWKGHWQKLIAHLVDVIPKHWHVIVCADRGLYADWLYRQIVANQWHPFLRINHQGTYRMPSQQTWQPLAAVVPNCGQSWSGRVVCFKTHPIECTLLARWDEHHQDPWLILTDLEPSQADVAWYGLRSSTEGVYRDLKSDGWQWHNTRLLDPQRAERLWLALAVATMWMVILGGEAENQSPSSRLELLSDQHIVFSKKLNPKPLRQISCFLLGFITLMANLLKGFSIHLPAWSVLPSSPVDTFYFSNSS